MSGLAAVFLRRGEPAGEDAISRLMDTLEHRGPDGSGTWVGAHVALGHQHFWLTPEETCEHQPLVDEGRQLALVFDGRLDNRPELVAALGLGPADGRVLSDADLVLRAYQHFGEAFIERLLGPFALVLWDGARHRLLCARDALGDRTLFFHADGRAVVVASEEQAVLAWPGVPSALCERSIARLFAVRAPEAGATLFAGVRELPPAHAVSFGPDGERRWRHWAVDPGRRLRGWRDEDYAARYLELMDLSVACRLRARTPVAVLMSGGLDSTSVAALAARHLTATAPAARLLAISYVFDELTSCDERPFIQAVIDRHGLAYLPIPADDAWPLFKAETWPRNPNAPEGNTYRLVKERAYARADQAGTRVVLTGAFSDHFYTGAEDWLAALVREARLREAATQIGSHVRRQGVRPVLASRTVRRLLRPPFWPSARSAPPPWLTAEAAELVAEPEPGRASAAALRLPARHRSVLGARAARSATIEVFHASRHGIELRHPYRDRRLVEFMLALPAHQLYNEGRYKHVLRNGMREILPGVVRDRHGPTTLTALYRRGIVEREASRARRLLDDPEALWPRFVRRAWLEAVIAGRSEASLDALAEVVVWTCISSVLWQRGATGLRIEHTQGGV